ncbi:MAG: orotate phosphoribosyltransferase [Planctomycetes bacterium]|nr:orotate phosphoribosyltransferase [Planctomycetota bacterium]
MTTKQLAARIKEVAYLEGEFTLRSGAISHYYLDKYLFETQPDILAELGRRFAAVAGDATLVAGAELGAVSLAAATSMASGLPYVIVRNARKGYGTGKQIEGALPAGAKVLLVEDIITSGGQVIEAARALTAAGATVLKIVGTIDRLQGGRENITKAGFAFEALLTREDLGISG